VKLLRVNINTPYKERKTGLIPTVNGQKKDAIIIKLGTSVVFPSTIFTER
jgi:hypothetical protein